MLDAVDNNHLATTARTVSASVGLEVSYTVSARTKQMVGGRNQPILDYLRATYARLPLDQIESVFGFVELSTLYGGRPFIEPELSAPDVWALYDYGIGLRLPISNSIVSRDEYVEAKHFLGKYHREGNCVIVTNDDLAGWVREDFPLFKIEASAIKNIDNLHKVKQAFKLYDTVVLPAKSNDDVVFLESIKEKEKIRLFLNAGCSYNCPSKICYPSMSSMNKYQGGEFRCSQSLIPREVKMHDFDEAGFVAMGFSRFKILRPEVAPPIRPPC